jgi:hypothetical protein
MPIFSSMAPQKIGLRSPGAVRVRQELRHQEQRDALRAFRCVRQARQHQVDDVFRHVVFAGRDEDLRAGDFVGAVGLRLGLRAQQAQVGAAVGFGQAHGAGPFARDQLRQVELLLVVGAVLLQALVGAVRQARVHRPGLVRRVQHLVEGVVQRHRQALAAVFRIAGQRGPAAFHVLFIRFLEALRRGDGLGGGVVVAAFAVAGVVQREQHFLREFRAFLEHLVDDVGVDFLVRRQVLELFGDVQEFMQNELHIPDWRDVLTHVVLLTKVMIGGYLVGIAVILDQAREAAVRAVDGAGNAQEAGIVVHRQHQAVHLVDQLLGSVSGLQVAAVDGLLGAAHQGALPDRAPCRPARRGSGPDGRRIRRRR